MAVSPQALDAITEEVFGALVASREAAPFTDRFPGFDLADAYKVVENIRQRREARGERIVGRKIGFTNITAWASYGISAPIWNYLYDKTTMDLTSGSTLAVGTTPFVRMETEVALGLGATPTARMSEEDLLACVEWVALDFEVCTSIFPDWRFKVADAASTGVHVALFLGERHSIGGERSRWARDLMSFSASLSESAGASADGGGTQVLGSPVKAFGQLVKELDRYGGEPLRAGDIVTTGTLTAALPAGPGQLWRAQVVGIPFAPIELMLT